MEEIFVSVVVPIHNHGPLLKRFLQDLQGVLEPNYADYEIILIDDDSTDNTPELVEGLLRDFSYVRYLRLSRQFGTKIGDYAGMEAAIGDFVVILSLEVDPVDLIPEMVDRAKQSQGIVYGVCRNRLDETGLFKSVKTAFGWLSRTFFNIPFVREATRFMVFSRRALNSYLAIKDRFRHVRLFTSYIGFPQEALEYQQVRRAKHVSRRSIIGEAGVGLHLVFANSTKPLRVVAGVGLAIALLNALRSAVMLTLSVSGETGVSILGVLDFQTAGLFLLLFFVLYILAEYVNSLVVESQDRPLYYVREEKSSAVLLRSSQAPNVVKVSTG
jgi:dolichol-phosphate mannosyltransferase